MFLREHFFENSDRLKVGEGDKNSVDKSYSIPDFNTAIGRVLSNNKITCEKYFNIWILLDNMKTWTAVICLFECFSVFCSSLTHFNSVAFYIETSHFSCPAKQMTGFYMKCNTWLNWVLRMWICRSWVLVLKTIFQKLL